MFRRVCYGLLAIILTLLCSCSDEKSRSQHLLQQAEIPLAAEQVILALQRCDDSTLEHLLRCGVHPNHCDEEGRSPLLLSVTQSNYRATMLLLRAGARAENPNPELASPLAMAAKNGDIPIALALMKSGANVNAQSINHEPLLAWCIKNGRYVIARSLLERKADPLQRDAEGNCALACAAHKQQRDLAVQLIALGAGAEMREIAQRSINPLVIQFMQNGWNDLIPAIVKNGADLQAKSPDGLSALDTALNCGDRESFQLLMKLGANNDQEAWDKRLWSTIYAGNSKQLKTLLDSGIKTEKPDEKGHSPLNFAINNKDLTIAEMLLQSHCSINSSYHLACEQGNTAAARLLEKYGATPANEGMGEFDSPLHCAIRSGNDEMVKHLLDQGVDTAQKGRDNQTPLVCAVARRHPAIVRLLLERKADPNIKLETKATATFLDSVEGAGMKWYLVNDRNITPLMLAADSGNLQTARELLAHGARKSVWTAVNKTWPLNFASRKGDVKMMRLLLNKDPEIEDRKIIVSIAKQSATVYTPTGETLFTTKVSTGKKGFATPQGTYVITNKHREWHSTIYDSASMPCFQRLSCSDFGFHQGVVPGYPASHGCLRVPAGNAQKFFALTELGDRVIIEP